MDELKSAFEKRNPDIMNAFGIRLKKQFELNRGYRRPKELEWLESLRQYKGVYDPDVVIEKNASKVYPKLTRSKVNIVLSRLHEMLFPEIDKNWEILPTPEPELAKEIVKQIAMSLVQQDEQTGQSIYPTADDLRLAIKEFSKITCENMSSEIDDQLTEMEYPEETKRVLRSGLMYGTGVMKGPLVGKEVKRRWEPDEFGEYQEHTSEEDSPELKFTRLWDWYPDMTVTDVPKMQGSHERHILSKHDLRGLIKRDDFYGEMIKQYMKDYPEGDYVPEPWETDLQMIEVEAGTGKEGATIPTSSTTAYGTQSSYRQIGRKYVMLEFWGYVDGSDLEACGIEIKDVELEYGACIWILGDRIVKAKLFDTPLDQYKVFYYEKDETSIYGEGLARVMRHSALAIAAGARMVLDNGACVAGPQVEVNWSLMTEDTDINSFYPRKIWFRHGRGIDAQYPALRVYDIASHVDELLKIIDKFEQFADIETCLPTWLIGQTSNETAQATSGRQAMISISIKDVVKNFDSFTEKNIKGLYVWNMEFNPRQDIKGDYLCKARGVSSLVMKEIRMQALNQLTSTLTPEEWDYVPIGELVKEKFKAHDIQITLRTEEEVTKMREAREQSIQAQLAIKMAESEIAYKRSQTMAMLSKAKEKNISANKEAQTPIEATSADDPRLAEADLQQKEVDRLGSIEQVRRDEEKHGMDMSHSDEAHRTKIATDTAKAAHEMTLTEQKVAHDMEMKGKMTEASAEAKKTAAKQKPVAKKPAKKGK